MTATVPPQSVQAGRSSRPALRDVLLRVAEAVTTATKAGVDLKKLFEVVSAGGANSNVFQRMMPWVLGAGQGGMAFKLRNGHKDVRYYTRLAEAVGSTAFLGAAVHQVFTLVLPWRS